MRRLTMPIFLLAALAGAATAEVPLPFGNGPLEPPGVVPAAAPMAPGDVAAGLAAAKAAEAAGRAEEAIRTLEGLLARSAGDERIRLALGLSLFRSGRPGAALPPLEAAVRLNPMDSTAWYVLGKAQAAAGAVDAAQACFRRARRLSPDHPGALLDAGRLDGVAGADEAARLFALAALARKPDRTDAIDLLVRVEERSGVRPVSRKAYEAFLKTAPHPAAGRHLARLQLAAGDPAGAERQVRRNFRPPALPAVEDEELLLRALLARRQFEAVRTLSVELLRRDPADRVAALGEAEALAGLSRHDEASLAALNLLKSVPDDPRATALRGYCLARTGRFREARSAYERAAALDPGDPAHAANLKLLDSILAEIKE